MNCALISLGGCNQFNAFADFRHQRFDVLQRGHLDGFSLKLSGASLKAADRSRAG